MAKKKNVKRGSATYIIRELQIKIIEISLHSLRMAKTPNPDNYQMLVNKCRMRGTLTYSGRKAK